MTVYLSPEGTAEIEAEMAAAPADTPERRATFTRMLAVSRWINGTELMTQCIREATAAMARMDAAMIHAAEQLYLRTHRRLPGGTSTARLRKKRRVAVMRWWEGRAE